MMVKGSIGRLILIVLCGRFSSNLYKLSGMEGSRKDVVRGNLLDYLIGLVM